MSLGPMEPGDRDRYITVQQLTAPDAAGGSGFPVESWTTLVGMWAARIDLSGSEKFKADQNAGKADAVWQIGYRADMDPELIDVPKKRRFTYQSRVYDIVSAALIGRREGVEIYTLAKAG